LVKISEGKLNDQDIDSIFSQLLAKEKGEVIPDAKPDEPDEKFLRGYSMGALVFSTIYFWAMGDSIFLWVSVVAAILFFPVLFVMPFVARKRAWQKHHWQNFAEFRATQQRWDKAGWYGLAAVVIFLFLAYQFVFAPLLNSLFPGGLGQLNDTKQELIDLQDL